MELDSTPGPEGPGLLLAVKLTSWKAEVVVYVWGGPRGTPVNQHHD